MCHSLRGYDGKARAIEHICYREFEAFGSKTIRLINRLEFVVEDAVDKYKWGRLSVDVIRSPVGHKNLSSHHWCFLDKLMIIMQVVRGLKPRDTEMMRPLGVAEAWEKLGSGW